MSTVETNNPDAGEHNAWQAAIDYGIDVSQLEYLMTLTPAERLQRHQQALELVRAMRRAGIDYYGFDPRLPDDPARLKGFSNLYLTTDLGQLDILDEIPAVGGYTEVAQHTVTVDVGGVSCRVLDIDALIQAKRALGRPRDVQAATELDAIRDRQRRQSNRRYQR